MSTQQKTYSEIWEDIYTEFPDPVTESVCEDLKRRSAVGVSKYGCTLERTDLGLREWLQHAYEECLDQAQYLKRAIMELEK